MKMPSIHIITASKTLMISSLIAVTLALSSQAYAEKINPPRYTIEVIVFENHAVKGWQEERWPNDIELPETEKSTQLSRHNKTPLWITSSNKQLMEVANRMRKSYRILFHQAWSQIAYKSKNAPTVLIENERSSGTTFLGTVRLYKTRFAHVEFDLEFERRIPSSIKEAFAQNQQIALEDLPSHWRFNLQESRKIKPGQLHFIDHPLFGILVQVHKIK